MCISCQTHGFSLGHSCADYKTAEEAIDKGAVLITHLFNAMVPVNFKL